LEAKRLNSNKQRGFHSFEPSKESTLEKYLDFSTGNSNVLFNSTVYQYIHWLTWTTAATALLNKNDETRRPRISNQLSVLGTSAGLFLVVAIAGFLEPPESNEPEDKLLIEVYGLLTFSSSVCLLLYIGFAFMGYYPIIESIRDDMMNDVYNHVSVAFAGGLDTILFNLGLNLMMVALLVALPIIYSMDVLWIGIVISVVIVS